MSASTFFEKTKAQMKNAVSTHPIEIFMITSFAIGIWFMELGSHQGNDHLGLLDICANLIYLCLSLSPIFLIIFSMENLITQ